MQESRKNKGEYQRTDAGLEKKVGFSKEVVSLEVVYAFQVIAIVGRQV